MESEQLKQENEKLTARLNKAVEVFKEQKANIDALINQRNELLMNVDAWKKSYDELNEEKEQLKTQLEEIKTVTIARDEWIIKYRELEKEYIEFKNNCISQEYFNDEVKRLNETISGAKKVYDDRCNDIANLKTQIAQFEKNNKDLTQSLEKYKTAYIEEKNQKEELQEKYNVLIEETHKIQKETESIIEKLNNELILKNDELTAYKLRNQKYQEFSQMIVDLAKSFDNGGNDILSKSVLELDQQDKQQKHIKQLHSNSRIGGEFMSDAKGMNI